MATLMTVLQRKVVLDAWVETLTEAPVVDRGVACAILGWQVAQLPPDALLDLAWLLTSETSEGLDQASEAAELVLQWQCRSFEVGA